MNSIGNDVVALDAIDVARTCTPRFYSKILTIPEQQLYHGLHGAIPFHNFVWLIWSVKEAAYKCLKRNQPDLVFSPLKLQIVNITPPAKPAVTITTGLAYKGFVNDGCFICEIIYQSSRLFSRAIIWGNDLIHSVVQHGNDFGNINWGIKQITGIGPENQSAAVREFTLAQLSSQFVGAELKVGKSAPGYPYLVVNGLVCTLPLSFSHHGSYVAYAVNLIAF
jgi:phosphopantetheinyl transferase (holo-ACP synthase)